MIFDSYTRNTFNLSVLVGCVQFSVITHCPPSNYIIIFINPGCGLTIDLPHLHFSYRADAPVLGHLWEYIFGDDIYG